MPVQTAKVSGRRVLRFEAYQQMLDDATQLAAGPHRCLGNWTLGQVCQHLARSMRVSLDGDDDKPGLPIRLMGRLMRKWVLTKPMSAGFQLPRRVAAKLEPAATSTADGLAALREVIARLERQPDRFPHPVFGKLSRDQWDQFHFRHAELHLSFVLPQ